MTTELVPVQEQQQIDYVPKFAIALDEAAQRFKDFKAFVKHQMVEDEDFGTIPGTAKPTLYKPGAEKLCNIFGLAPQFEEVRTVEDWDDPGFFYYAYNCRLFNKRTGQIEAECTASCNSKEDKYRWRVRDKECPNCGETAIRKGAEQYGGGWYCNRKAGGCGAKFKEGDEVIEGQAGGKIPNPEVYTLVNTFQKMAQKRALVGAVLIATRASGFFTQDLEDLNITATEEPKAKKTAKKGNGGKVSDDPMSTFWLYAKKKDVEESAADVLEEQGQDAEKALIVLKELCGDL